MGGVRGAFAAVFVAMLASGLGGCAGGGTSRPTAIFIPLAPTAEAARDLIKANTAAKQYRRDEAVAIYTRLINSETFSPPGLAILHLQRGMAGFTYSMAYPTDDNAQISMMRDFQKSRDLLPSAAAFMSEGNALVALGAYADATQAFKKARDLEQGDAHWSLISLARVERILGHYDAALGYLDELFRLHGEATATMPMYYHRGWTLRLQGRYAEAVDAFTKGLPKQPTYYAAYGQRACAYALLGKYDEASTDAKRALELVDNSDDAEMKLWVQTPFGKSSRQDLVRDLATITAAGKASTAQRASLCQITLDHGEKKRSMSPGLSL